MSYTPALDVSTYQGALNFASITEPIVVIRASYSYQGKLYTDDQCNHDYYNAKQNGKAVGLYHFAGGTDPVAEADFFIKCASPLEEGDVLVLDWEVEIINPVAWCKAFLERVIARAGVIPLIYMDTDRENRFNWAPVVAMNVGLWVADYRFTPEENVPIRHWPSYVMHQYNSSPIDHDAFFGSVEQWKAYGWLPAKLPNPAPAPETPAVPAPAPPPTPETVPSTPVPIPLPELPSPPAPEPEEDPQAGQEAARHQAAGFLARLLLPLKQFLKDVIDILRNKN